MRAWVLAALSLLCAAAAPATDVPVVLGTEGEVYRLLQGTRGELLAPAQADDTPVLVLEIVRPGAASERLLVPGTDGPALEQYPALTVDGATESVYLVWEAQSGIHSTLHLAGYGREGWSEVFELSGDPFSLKHNPQLATTADSYHRLEGGGVTTVTRVVLHLAWWDDSSSGLRPLYTPLIIEDGRFVPTWRVFALTDFLAPGTAAAASTLPLGLYDSPQVRATGTGVVIAFGDPGHARLAVVEARPVSGGLVAFADAARAEVLAVSGALPTLEPRSVADRARAQIIDIGRKLLKTEVSDFLTAHFLAAVAAAPSPGELGSVADEARAQIIDIGASLTDGPRRQSGAARAQIIDIGARAESPGTPQLSGFRVASVRNAPWVPNRPIRLIASDNGEHLIIAWDLDGSVRYRQSQGEGWSDIRSLTLGEQLSREQAYQLLTQRVQRRQ